MSPLVDKDDNLTPAGRAVIGVVSGLVAFVAMGALITVAWHVGYHRPQYSANGLFYLGGLALLLLFIGALTRSPDTTADEYSAHDEQANVARRNRRA